MADKHKCFISFKKENEAYKKAIQQILGDQYIDKSLNERINSEDHDYVMRVLREKYLSDSTVTIVLIGSFSAENLGAHEQYYIKSEIAASLYNGDGNTRNGILGVVLPEAQAAVYGGTYTCQTCGGTHNLVHIDDTTVVREFSANYYLEPCSHKCYWAEEDRYCVLVKYEDFINDADTWIQKAFDKRSIKELTDKVKVRV